jgi:hypothetical protein
MSRKTNGCGQTAEKLSAFVDGDLPAPEAQAMRAHAAGCPDCTATIADLSSIVLAARGFDRPDPPPSLWPAVEGAMARHDRPWWLSLRLFGTGALVGAAAMSMVVLGVTTWRAHPASPAAPTPLAVAAPDPLLEEAEAEFARAQHAYERSIEKLRGLLAREEPRWSPEERARCSERLAQLDEAIANSREVARKSPADTAGNEQLFAAYQQKIAFLAEAVHRGGTFREGEPRP